MASDYYDDLETRSADERATEQATKLARQVAHAKEASPGFAATLADVDAASINSLEALAKLPVVRKSELIQRQAENPPLGGMGAVEPGQLAHIYMSPGPIFEGEGQQDDAWRFARAAHAAGFRAGDIVHNTFSYHLTPAGMMVDSGCKAIGCAVFPGGIGNTEIQVQALGHLRPNRYAGTPSFLKIILEKAVDMNVDTSSLLRGLVGGEALPPSLRGELSEFGCDVLQCYGTADLGLIAYESDAKEGMIIDEGVMLEIVRPGTGDPVPNGEVGEVVVTTFNSAYPLIRFGTGDMSAIMEGASPCGRTNTRIKGWMGRADQTTKVKGMFVHPSQVADVVKRHKEIAKARLVVTGRTGSDTMTLHAEVEGGDGDALYDAVKQSIQTVTKLRGEVRFAALGELANDGVVIEDARNYD
ncbi:MAG: AMP-dependent synthetase [Rhodospirillaceae bacterium]|nr:AMP-dependent synthetase [Rhodospirillaceae bacterium]